MPVVAQIFIGLASLEYAWPERDACGPSGGALQEDSTRRPQSCGDAAGDEFPVGDLIACPEVADVVVHSAVLGRQTTGDGHHEQVGPSAREGRLRSRVRSAGACELFFHRLRCSLVRRHRWHEAR